MQNSIFTQKYAHFQNKLFLKSMHIFNMKKTAVWLKINKIFVLTYTFSSYILLIKSFITISKIMEIPLAVLEIMNLLNLKRKYSHIYSG